MAEKGIKNLFQGFATVFVENAELKPGELYELTIKHYTGFS